MNIKKKISFFVAVALLFVVSIFVISFKNADIPEETQVVSINDDEPLMYWFFVRVRIDTRLQEYKISGTSGGLNYGYKINFEKNLWSGLSKRQIAVGPFFSRNEALNAKRLYKTGADKITKLPEGEVPDNVFWFAINFKQSDRLRIFILDRAPGAVASGSEQAFITAFYEQLAYKQLAIGPFYFYEQAEEAKTMYRLNE